MTIFGTLKGLTLVNWINVLKRFLKIMAINSWLDHKITDYGTIISSFVALINSIESYCGNLTVDFLLHYESPCMLGNFHDFFCRLLTFYKINFFEKFFQEYNQSVKQLASRSGPTFCRA